MIVLPAEHVSFDCKCGNSIEYVDYITPGHREREEITIVCRKCKRKHDITYSGRFSIESGAMALNAIGTADCPICGLTSDQIDKMTEKEILDMVSGGSDDTWCTDHMLRYLSVRKSRALMGKPLLRALID